MTYKAVGWYRERDARWAAMHRAGMTYREIAEATRYDEDYISKRVRAWEAAHG